MNIISDKVISNELLEFIKHKLTDEEHALFAESFYYIYNTIPKKILS
jgi:hypothetical protein